MKIYNKLIRDKIPQIITASDKKFDTHIASEKEYTESLETKLKEEVNEYLSDKNLEELADVMEVIFALAKNLGYSEDDLINKRNEKSDARGGFDKKIILEKVYD
jgi:predicted house-cleaning noncanonical NTP pyrophosphatase (MazG superfamily)